MITTEIDAPKATISTPKGTVSLRGLLAACAITVGLAVGGSYAVATVAAPDGPAGARGATGAQGPTGERGPRGRHGKTGLNGASGANGANGSDGATIVEHRACSNDVDVPLPYC
jgi:hypothetical protein